MTSITEAFGQLELFSSREDVASGLEIYRSLNPTNRNLDSALSYLRGKLRMILADQANDNIKSNTVSLSDAAYAAALALAGSYPINKDDPCTQERIEDENKIFTSSGHQFDLVSLIQYHHARSYRDDKRSWPHHEDQIT